MKSSPLQPGVVAPPGPDTTQMGIFASELTKHAEGGQANFVLVSADSSSSLRFSAFRQRYPERVIEVGIAEGCAMAVSFGLARAGLKVFVGGYANFLLMRSLEVIRSYVAYHRADITILGGMAGFTASHDGYMHQAVEDVGLMRLVGNIRILLPSDEETTRAAARGCLDEPGPCYVRLVRRQLELPPPLAVVGPLVWRVKRGDDVLLCSHGALLGEAVVAAAELGVNATVLEVGRVAPMPTQELLAAARAFNLVFVIEDHDARNGVGAVVAEALTDTATRVRHLGVSTRSLQSGSYEAALLAAGLTPGQIAQTVLRQLRSEGFSDREPC